ncbi:hypothetical protein AVEN_196331-1 [Araneus ventricosus]|uniref:Uncharacterized protein n=1 Tax=Araneus ventricosus TaxID=182803 RepID=A0A4Y2ATV9_ARAVE|nr:hypothetical protein AVEN_196331-1 [Araneus ventricosus]
MSYEVAHTTGASHSDVLLGGEYHRCHALRCPMRWRIPPVPQHSDVLLGGEYQQCHALRCPMRWRIPPVPHNQMSIRRCVPPVPRTGMFHQAVRSTI